MSAAQEVKRAAFRLMTFGELMELELPPPDFGPWILDPNLLVLIHHETRYEIDLERCLTAFNVIDWICQVAGKIWADDRTLAGLVRAFRYYLNPQGRLRGTTRLTVKEAGALVLEAHRRMT